MHIRNGHAPYADIDHAISYWPETATAVAARLGSAGAIEIRSPFGFDDLLALIVRPSRPDTAATLFRNRVQSKGWLRTWPKLTVVRPT